MTRLPKTCQKCGKPGKYHVAGYWFCEDHKPDIKSQFEETPIPSMETSRSVPKKRSTHPQRRGEGVRAIFTINVVVNMITFSVVVITYLAVLASFPDLSGLPFILLISSAWSVLFSLALIQLAKDVYE